MDLDAISYKYIKARNNGISEEFRPVVLELCEEFATLVQTNDTLTHNIWLKIPHYRGPDLPRNEFINDIDFTHTFKGVDVSVLSATNIDSYSESDAEKIAQALMGLLGGRVKVEVRTQHISKSKFVRVGNAYKEIPLSGYYLEFIPK